MSNSSVKGWKLYELFVARLMSEQTSTDLCVTANARIKGRISGRSRQMDVLIDSRHDTDNSRRIIVDAKRRRRKIDVTHVEAFKGLIEDVGATHGLLVCPVGHTKAAAKRAQEIISLRLVPLDRLENFNPTTWPKCQNRKCKTGRVLWDGYPAFTTRLRLLGSLGKELHSTFIHFVGKCDRCGRFHIKCNSSERTFALTDEDERGGCCLPLTFWLTSIEQDEGGFASAELHAITKCGDIITVNRRPM